MWLGLGGGQGRRRGSGGGGCRLLFSNVVNDGDGEERKRGKRAER